MPANIAIFFFVDLTAVDAFDDNIVIAIAIFFFVEIKAASVFYDNPVIVTCILFLVDNSDRCI